MNRLVSCCSAIDIQQWLPQLKSLLSTYLPNNLATESPSSLNLVHPSLPPALFLLPPAEHNAFLAPETLPVAVPKDVILIMRTSGSTTGTGKIVGLTLNNLISSAQASTARLGTPGAWAVALPCWHIAGLQCVIRSLLAGYEPIFISQTRFSPAVLTQCLNAHPMIKYISLVPTQLQKCLADPQAIQALSKLHGILVGGAHTDNNLLSTAKYHNIRVVTTYGSTESSGGCVYDGVAFTHTTVSIDTQGRVTLTGPTISPGYLHVTDTGYCDLTPFSPSNSNVYDTNFSFPTNDHGELKNNILHIYGRLDDAITSGGETISPVAVENIIRPVLKQLCQQLSVQDLAISYLPDPVWGQAITLVLQGPSLLKQNELSYLASQIIATNMPKMWHPKYLCMISDFPYTALGKLKRNQLALNLPKQPAQRLTYAHVELVNDQNNCS